ncbi:MAG: DUF4912 domain-containing protein [Spirochaetes bacterium]|uniref:DUF4912 domain-containing protein n=1 Tax=Candidatus Avitreponema avistercoris TaxID=2840705 RepID=A0A9D9ELF6_9SPIR|nr:DUF4912 domain-containing protein [Candidatus Avitreponema avistercoris]
MEHISLTRAYLETLTTEDLVRLGDEFGIDIPPALNRHLIIGELLEIQADFYSDTPAASSFADVLPNGMLNAVPESYNETCIRVLLRNPGWVFVFWDFRAVEFSACTAQRGFESFGLRTSFFEDSALTERRDSYSIAVSPSDRKWYIHLSERDCFCRVDLIAMHSDGKDLPLAQSNTVVVPPAAGIELSKAPGVREPPLLALSGIGELRKRYWRNHRQSFL